VRTVVTRQRKAMPYIVRAVFWATGDWATKILGVRVRINVRFRNRIFVAQLACRLDDWRPLRT